MVKKQVLLFFILILTTVLHAQIVQKSLLKSNSFECRNSIYVYGYEQNKNDLVFKCYSFTKQLTCKDSIEFTIGKYTPADFVDINADTLHECLNFYFQQANQKNVVSLLRCTDKLTKICTAENYDANRINAVSVFENEKYYYKNNLYTIRSVDNDTAGSQFYLTKLSIKTLTKPFEYEYKWQFPFERKNIHRAIIIYADTTEVLIYANVGGGLKKGQWILRINANKGTLIKGTKLSTKSDTRHFLYSNCIYNPTTKLLNVIGSIYDAKVIDFNLKTYNFTNQSKGHKLFIVSIDSVGDVLSRYEKLFPLPIQTKTTDALKSFHVKVREFAKSNNNGFNCWLDMYEMSQPNVLCYQTSWQFSLTPNDIDYELKLSKLSTATKALPKLISFENGDAYGKFYLKDITEYDKFKCKANRNSVVLKTDLDDAGNTYFIIKKVNILSSTKTYNYVFTGKKGLEIKALLNTEQGQKSNLFFTNKLNYISFLSNTVDTQFELKLNSL